jgi:serine/threonine protein kinase
MRDIKQVGRYKIESILGEGAMGIVYKAHDPIIKRTVAIKLIKVGDGVSETEKKEFYERFYREAQISGTLNHPNIVGIYDIGEEQGMPYIAMEFIEGKTLSEIIAEQGRLDIESAVKILSQVASALDYAHKKGIVHRDIKPGNIMIGEDTRCKIMDFGIAKLQNSSLTQTGAFLGTPSYSSPEQITEGTIDHRSDIFSLGTVTYEMITGSLPFKGQTLSSILYKIAHEPPEKIENAEKYGINTAAWNKLFARVFAKNPDERFQGAKEFSSEFARAVTLTSSQKSRIRKLLVDHAVDTETAIDKQLYRNEYEIERAKHQVIKQKKSKKGVFIWLFIVFALIGGVAGANYFTNGEILKEINTPIKKIFTSTVEKQFTIITKPQGAQILVNNKVVGITPNPFTLSGEEGTKKTITLTKENYIPYTFDTILSEEVQTDYNIKLKSKLEQITVLTKPAKINFTVDNNPQIFTTPADIKLDTTIPHNIRYFADGYVEKIVVLNPGELPGIVEMVPIAKPGFLTIDSSFPVNLYIRQNGKWINKGIIKPKQKLKLDAGNYTFRLTSKKYFYSKEFRNFEVVSGKKNTLYCPPLGTIKKIDTYPIWATVYIDGVKLEDTPIVEEFKIVTGKHKIKFLNNEANIEKNIEINVSAGEKMIIKERLK